MIFLATAQATITTEIQEHKVRVLIDTGSELSFITESFVRNVNLKRLRHTIEVSGIGGLSTRTKGRVNVTLRSIHREDQLKITAHILPVITTRIPSQDFELDRTQINKLKLADEFFNKARSIDIIIGADYYGNIIKPNVIKFHNMSLIAQLSIFGWLIIGSTSIVTSSSIKSESIISRQDSGDNMRVQLNKIDYVQCSQARSIISELDLDLLLKLFWVQEEPPSNSISTLSYDEQQCEQHFKSTCARDQTGRYIVRIPLKESVQQLGNSYTTAHYCLQRTKKRLLKDSNYQSLYTQFMNEYEQLDHMRKIPDQKINIQEHYYLPHHGVLREQSTTTKLRVVFNGSSNTSSGKSINDIMYPGRNLLLNIVDVLTWIRQYKHLFSTDITKMFRQIQVHPDDWDLQRILWIDSQGREQHYYLTTVTYGTRAAPYLAVRTLLQLVEDEGHNYPHAVPSLIHGRYVDDIFGGGDTPKELEEKASQLSAICKAGGFPLAKWHSSIPQDTQEMSDDAKIKFDNCDTQILGIYWSPSKDTFTFSTLESNNIDHKCTKRLILSKIATIFDPLGFASPIIIKAKILMQELWLLKLGWDDSLPSTVTQKWCIIRDELMSLTRI